MEPDPLPDPTQIGGPGDEGKSPGRRITLLDFGFKLKLEAKDGPARKRKHMKTGYTEKPRKIKEAGANLAPESPTVLFVS